MAQRGIKRVFATPLDTVDTEAKEELGTIRFDGNKVYKYVKYVEGGDAVNGVANQLVKYSELTGYVNNEVTMDFDHTDTTVAAGLLVAALTDGQFGWIQIKGYAVSNLALQSAPADGDALSVGSPDGTFKIYDEAEQFPACAISIDTSAKTVLLDCPF